MSLLIRFKDYEVDLAAGQLRKRGLKVRLPEQAFQVLSILLEHPMEAVTREELRRRLWPEDVFVDFDNNLNSAIARLREALNDSAEHPRFVETLPKHGYRFIAGLSDAGRSSHPAPAGKPKLVVLPVVNLSGDPGQEYFGDAITDDIITTLAVLAPEQLAVIARTTAMHYKGGNKDVATIGRELHVDYVLEGSVRRSGEQLGLNVQLIQTSDQTHLWAKMYNAGLRDRFDTLSAIAQAVASQLGLTPTGRKLRPTRKPTEHLPAYNLYLLGRYHMYRATAEDIAKARHCFEDAIARDPEFALAYDSLAEIHWYLGFAGFAPPKETCATGMFYALRALEIDPTLAETHALVGMYREELDYDWPEVHREMARALELNPASPVVRLRYALSELMPQGRIEDAAAEIERALEFDPLSALAHFWLGLMFVFARKRHQAIEQGQLLLGADPTYYPAYFVLGVALRGEGKFEEAIAAHRRAAELSNGSPVMLGWLGLALAQSGSMAEARSILDRLHMIARNAYVPPTSFAWVHLALGETASFFTWMDRAIEVRDHHLIPIKSYPFLDPIRADARYRALLRRMNLKP